MGCSLSEPVIGGVENLRSGRHGAGFDFLWRVSPLERALFEHAQFVCFLSCKVPCRRGGPQFEQVKSCQEGLGAVNKDVFIM